MLNKLFNSKTRINILALFFGNPGKSFYVQEIIKLSKTDAANAHRELQKLLGLGILKSKKQANQKYFRLNKDNEYFNGLKELFEKYNEKNAPEKWFAIEEMPNYYPMMVCVPWSLEYANKTLKEFSMKNKFSELMAKFENNLVAIMVKKNEFDAISGELVELFINRPEVGKKYNEKVREKTKKLIKATDEFKKTNFSSLSNKQLAAVYEKYYGIYIDLHNLHWIQTCADFGENIFSKYLMSYLRERIKKHNYKIGDVFSVLTNPSEESNASFEYRDLLKILEVIEGKKKLKDYFSHTDSRLIMQDLKNISPELDKKIDLHTEKYGWLGYNTAGPGWNKEYFVDILRSLVSQKASAKSLLKKYESEKEDIIKRQKELIKKLKIDKKHQIIFENARNIVFTKGLRKDSMFYSYSVMESFFRELGKRFYISLKQARYFHPLEIKKLLLGKKIDTSELNERYKFSLYYSNGKFETDKFIEGKEGKKVFEEMEIIQEDISNVKSLQGDCASPGRVRGNVAIINVPEDMKKMEDGKVLVSIATTPDLVPAIKKSSSIVTDIGGITCHAAIVSRELGIPCVIGTKFATKILRDGDLVDVDASHGKINIIKKAK